MGKIVFLDIDGTIRGFDGHVPDSAAAAIRQARAAGHKVLISSGRPLCQIEPGIIDIGFDGIISGSGSYVLYEGKCVRHEYFPAELYKELAQTLLDNDCIIQLQCYDRSCILKEQLSGFEALAIKIQALLGPGAKKLVEMPDIVENAGALARVEKIIYFSDCFSNDDLKRRWGDALYVVPVSFPNAMRYGGEISLASVNKAEGMKAILAAAGASVSDTIAIGDSENDLEMIRFAGLGIAMGNGTQAVKAAADMITDDLEADGLYKAFEKAGLL